MSGDFEFFAAKVLAWLPHQAFQLCHDWFEADDLVQITLLKLYLHWHQLHDHEALTPYLRQTLFHTFLSERRRSRWRHEASFAEPPDRPARESTVDERVALEAALRRLGPRQRQVMILRFVDDLSVEQTASLMGCSVGTVTSQTHRALSTLRAALSEEAAARSSN